MDTPHPHGETPPDPPHPDAQEGPLTFRLGKPLNGHSLNGQPVKEHPPATATANAPNATTTHPPATGPSDPRWVLAIRAREALRGNALPDDQHRKLIRLGALLGLAESQIHHILNAVQSQARRGLQPSALDLLGHLPEPPATDDEDDTSPRRIITHAALWSTLLLLAELLIIFAVL